MKIRLSRSLSALSCIALACSLSCSKREQALPVSKSTSSSQGDDDVAEALVWQSDLDTAQALAREKHLDLFIDFSAEWCAPCKQLDKVTFADPDFAAFLRRTFVPLKLDVTQLTAADKSIMERFSSTALPALLVVRGEQVILRIDRFMTPIELEKTLRAR